MFFNFQRENIFKASSRFIIQVRLAQPPWHHHNHVTFPSFCACREDLKRKSSNPLPQNWTPLETGVMVVLWTTEVDIRLLIPKWKAERNSMMRLNRQFEI